MSSQEILTSIEVDLLGSEHDLSEDSEVVALAVKRAFDEARELGGHAQRLVALDIDEVHSVETWASQPVARRATINLRTRLT